MPRSSPPKHRHDGSSPLPLGMDWSPPPKKWEGRNTIWPHDPKTGWSYCIMVPSWIVQAGSGTSSESLLNPIVFYRIQVGIQSPKGVSSSHGILRRFSDFLKLYSALKRVFPKKDIPTAPPKHALLRINSSRLLLEERGRALEEWMGKLLSDIDLSRSAPIATFLELEAAARSSFQDATELSLEASTSGNTPGLASNLPGRLSSSASAECSSIASKSQSVTSDASNDIAFENSDTEEIFDGVMVGTAMLEQSGGFVDANLRQQKDCTGPDGDNSHWNPSTEAFLLRDRVDSTLEHDRDKLSFHSRKLSTDSIGSDASSIRTSELLIPGATSSVWDGSIDLSCGVEFPGTIETLSNTEKQFANDAHILLHIDQRNKLNGVLLSMQRRFLTARTDMEDIIARLNQEMAVKEYLKTKVKGLEVELEVTKLRNKENLQQAVLLERERYTQTQWDMDELNRKYLELETKLKFEQIEKAHVKSENTNASGEKEILQQDLAIKQGQIEILQKNLEQLEMKSKADIKVLVKEVKFLRNTQAELKEMLNQSTKEKADLERVLENNKQRWAHAKSTRRKLLHECEILRYRIQESSVDFLAPEEDKFTVNPSSISDALGVLKTSDNRIGLLIAEAQLLVQEDEEVELDQAKVKKIESSGDAIAINGDYVVTGDEGMRRMLIDTIIDNARLRKQMNSVFRCALKAISETEKGRGDETSSRKTVLNMFLESGTTKRMSGLWLKGNETRHG